MDDARQTKYFLYVLLPRYIEYVLYILFLILIILLGIRRAVYHGYFDWSDSLLWQSWFHRMSYGEVPMRDFFASYGPVLPWLFYFPFRILGGDFLAWNIVCYLGLSVASYSIAVAVGRKLFKTGLFRIVFLLLASVFNAWGFFLYQPWMFRVWLGLFLAVLVFGKLKQRFFWIGAWAVFLFFTSFEQGLFSIAILTGLGGVWIVDRLFTKELKELRELKKYVYQEPMRQLGFGAGAVFACFVFVFAITGSLQSYFSFFFGRLSAIYLTVAGLEFPLLSFNIGQKGLWAFLSGQEVYFYLPILIYIVSGIVLSTYYYFFRRIYWVALFITAYGLLSFKTVMTRSDFEHLDISFVPALLLVLWLSEQALFWLPKVLEEKKASLLLAFKVTILALVVLLPTGYFFATRSPSETGFLTLFTPRALYIRGDIDGMTYVPKLRVYIYSGQAKTLNEVLSYLSDNPGRFYTHDVLQGFFFLTNKKNPTYFDQDGWATEDEQAEMMRILEKKKNKYIIENKSFVVAKGGLFGDYIKKYYTQKKEIGEIVISERTGEPFDEEFEEHSLVLHFKKRWDHLANSPFRIVLPPVEFSKIRLAVNPEFFPLMSSFSKIKATLYYPLTESKWQAVSSDTIFLTPFDPKGQLVFHFDKPVKANSLQLVFTSPGGLNPPPLGLDILETWMYK